MHSSAASSTRLLVPQQRRVDVVDRRNQADAGARGQLTQQRLRLCRAQPCACVRPLIKYLACKSPVTCSAAPATLPSAALRTSCSNLFLLDYLHALSSARQCLLKRRQLSCIPKLLSGVLSHNCEIQQRRDFC